MKVLLLTMMMIFATSASAGLYKWVDNEGNVHYSQKRPLNKQYKRLKAPPPAPENSKSPYQSKKQSSETDDTATAETIKNKKIRETNCANAKKNLNAYQVYRRIRDKDGNVRPIDDNERAKQIKQAKQAINDFCN